MSNSISRRVTLAAALCSAALGAFSVDAQAGTLIGAEVWSQARLTTIDRASGQQTTVGFFGDPPGPFGLALNNDNGQLYMVDQAPNTKGLYTVNMATGAATRVGAAGVFGGARPRGLGYDSVKNVMYTSDLDTNQLLVVNLTTGAPSMVAPFVNFGAVEAMTYDNDNGVLWGVAGFVTGGGSGRHLVSIDPDTGLGTSVISLGSGSGSSFRGLAYDPELGVLWTHNISTGFLTTLDPLTGVVTPIGHTQQDGWSGTSLNALAFIPAPSAAFGLAGLMGFTLARRRRA